VTATSVRLVSAAAAVVLALQLVSGQTPAQQPPAQPPAAQTPPTQAPPVQTPPAQVPPAQPPAQTPPAQAPAPQRQQPSFRAGVDLVSLNVTVTDGTTRYVTDLAQEDFNVFEDGVKQEVTFFNRTNLPIALALLLDTSASMENKLGTAQEAAIGFARKLRSQDLAEVIDFDSRVVILQNFTSAVGDLESAIKKTSAGGSTSLYNAVYIALKDLKKVVARNVDEIRRQAIVVLSDGEDTSSLLPFEEVLDLAKRSETAIYSIGLRSEGPSTSSRGFKEAEFVLRQFSQETGGRSFFPNQINDLSTVYGQIADELSSQYTVGYTSRNPKRDGSWRRLVVRVNRPNLTARTKQGYFAPTTH
jgi:Ca-activated chloride channel homolog